MRIRRIARRHMAHLNLPLSTATLGFTFAFGLALALGPAFGPALAFGLACVLCLVDACGLACRFTYYALGPVSSSCIRRVAAALRIAIAARFIRARWPALIRGLVGILRLAGVCRVALVSFTFSGL